MRMREMQLKCRASLSKMEKKVSRTNSKKTIFDNFSIVNVSVLQY